MGLSSLHNRFIWHIMKIKGIPLHVSRDFGCLKFFNFENKERGPHDLLSKTAFVFSDLCCLPGSKTYDELFHVSLQL
jgi:hypothetical protein